MKIALVSGAEAEYDLQKPDSFPSSYFFSIERSGSSLFWHIVTDLLKAAGRSYCEPLEYLFRQGIAQSDRHQGLARPSCQARLRVRNATVP